MRRRSVPAVHPPGSRPGPRRDPSLAERAGSGTERVEPPTGRSGRRVQTTGRADPSRAAMRRRKGRKSRSRKGIRFEHRLVSEAISAASRRSGSGRSSTSFRNPSHTCNDAHRPGSTPISVSRPSPPSRRSRSQARRRTPPLLQATADIDPTGFLIGLRTTRKISRVGNHLEKLDHRLSSSVSAQSSRFHRKRSRKSGLQVNITDSRVIFSLINPWLNWGTDRQDTEPISAPELHRPNLTESRVRRNESRDYP